ncbi:apolipoprotein N-acyltransferase [Herbaspirillum sp. Sphag1AN]|uniref:apolipoprotein N-acyltransferase n=1 Tax=unclassified Herbaspirillum TaxID=2624150 RepID=UPI00160841A2|nr:MULTISPECIES: apolipoprotein N-acyltransferase [unclassified Herbaspirillum]MBB3214243.1 apolipoprotein N-acyltransferase [Herbaspirillum sp. Sphag1AN]MBB3247205.1 apolipoprotein N-acyltransferase [Herbaspirillum sp. Sphag64]
MDQPSSSATATRSSLTVGSSRWMPLFALLAGMVNVLAFAPFSIWPLQILTLAWLFRQLLKAENNMQGWRRQALLGWLYGLGWAACGVHWLYISMHDYGGMASWMAALAVVLLATFLGLYAGLAMAVSAWLRRRWFASDTNLSLLILPSAWALSEWTRGWFFTGFPWLTSGYAHNIGPLSGFAPVMGVYGVAWIAALISGALALLSLRKATVTTRMQRSLPAVMVILLGITGLALHHVNWTQPMGKPISVRLLQGNIPQEMKFSNEALLSNLLMYEEMINSAPADLIATPETAVPLLPEQLPPDYLRRITDFVQSSGSHLALGIPISDGPGQYANSIIGLSPDPASATRPYRYDKHHLVPFGEFIPFGFRWFVDLMHIPLGDMRRGHPLQGPWQIGQQWVMPNICYEDLFGEEIAAQLRASYNNGTPLASILLNASNIAWFGNSIALPQHLEISQMRALETGRPMLRSTNTGTTAVIDPKGQILSALQPLSRGVLTASVQGYAGVTPYILLGNALMLACTLAALVLGWWLAHRRR